MPIQKISGLAFSLDLLETGKPILQQAPCFWRNHRLECPSRITKLLQLAKCCLQPEIRFGK